MRRLGFLSPAYPKVGTEVSFSSIDRHGGLGGAGRTVPGGGLSPCGAHASLFFYDFRPSTCACRRISSPKRTAWMAEASETMPRLIGWSPLQDPPGHGQPAGFSGAQRWHALAPQQPHIASLDCTLSSRRSFGHRFQATSTLRPWWSVMLPGGYWVGEDEFL